MAVPFMRAYAELLVRTCHKRGAHAIGGMAAFIPSRSDPEVNETRAREGARGQGARERAGLRRYVGRASGPGAGRDGDLRRRARRRAASEGYVARGRAQSTAQQLLDTRIEGAQITHDGVVNNISVGMRYIDAWLRGTGAVAIYNLMEDAATAEISRAQLWQWRVHNAPPGRRRACSTRAVREDARRADGRNRAEKPVRTRVCAKQRELLDSLVLSDRFRAVPDPSRIRPALIRRTTCRHQETQSSGAPARG